MILNPAAKKKYQPFFFSSTACNLIVCGIAKNMHGFRLALSGLSITEHGRTFFQ